MSRWNEIKSLAFYLKPFRLEVFFLGLTLVLGAITEFATLSLFIPILEYIKEGPKLEASNAIMAKILAILHQCSIEPTLFNLLLIAFFASAFQFLMIFLQNTLTANLFFPVRKNIRDRCFANLMDFSLEYFNSHKSGDLINIMTERIDTVGYSINMLLLIAADCLLVVTYLSFLIIVSFQVTLAVLGLAVLKYFLTICFVRRSRKLGERWLDTGKAQTSRLLESLQGIRLIKSLSREEEEKKRFAVLTKKLANVQIFYSVNEEWMKLWDSLVTPAVFCVIIFLSVGIFKISGSYVLIFLLALMKLIPRLTKINVNRNQLSINMANTEAILNLLDPTNKPKIKSGPVKINAFNNSIRFNHVSFSYRASESILNQASFTIPKGERLAIVGASGSGKSSLINLLLRFYDPNSGSILVDGQDLRDLDIAAWHQLIGFVDQDTFIFNDTVYNNIAYGYPKATEEEITAAAKKAHIHELIVGLKDGYQTLLGDRGVKFSGGQRQRIAIARAILKKPEILIFDEATSSLDSISEEMIRASIDEISLGCTTILVAHRLSTVRNADQIIVLEQGKIVERGKHSQLLAMNGKYREYHEAQSRTVDVH